MTLDDYADLAQIVSGIAVLFSLAYLAYEIRQGARELKVATQLSQTEAHAEMLLTTALDPEARRLVAAVMSNQPLPPVDYFQVQSVLTAYFLHFQAGYEAASVGANPSSWWRQQRLAVRRWLMTAMVREWWRSDRELYSPGFRAVVDEELAAVELLAAQ